MTDIVERLLKWSKDMRLFGNADQDLREAADEIDRLRGLVRCLVENDPDDDAADGVTVLDVWRKDAVRALKEKAGD
jgi:hypothetical protein